MAATRVVLFALSTFVYSSNSFLAPEEHHVYYSKQEVLNGLTPTEYRLIFGETENPAFDVIYPEWAEHVYGEDGRKEKQKKLRLSASSVALDFILEPSNGFISPNIPKPSSDVNNNVNMNPKECHWRFVNATYVITVDECFRRGLHALIISENIFGIIYPINLRNSKPYVLQDIHPHIWYQVDRDVIKSHLRKNNHELKKRRKRDIFIQEDDEKNIKNEDVTQFESIDEFLYFPEIRVDLESDLEKFRAPNGHQDFIIGPLNTEPQLGDLKIRLRKTIEIAVFCDWSLVQSFGKNLQGSNQITISQYIRILVNALEGIYHQEELNGYIIDLKLVYIGLLGPNEGPNSFNGDIGKYLKEFSSWQKKLNPLSDNHPQHWDHAILLSGLDLHSGGNTGVIGLAWVGGMCNADLSSTINEGGSFLSLYIVAHEMGHSIGMDHDGSNTFSSCNSQNHIMSPSVGPGKTTWSPCSIQVVRQFLSKTTCLDDASSSPFTTQSPSSTTISTPTSPEIEKIKAKLPGQVFPPRLQCQLALGPQYFPIRRQGNDMCSYLFCSGEGTTRGAHPALQGSECGSGMICIAGSCKPEEELRRLIVLFLDITKELDIESTEKEKKKNSSLSRNDSKLVNF